MKFITASSRSFSLAGPTVTSRQVERRVPSHPQFNLAAGRAAGARDVRRDGRCQGAANDALTKIKDEGGQGTSEQYSSAIAEMSASGEWMPCAELLTEAKLLRLSLEQEALESAAAVLSGPEADQGAKAADVLSAHLKAGGSVSLETICAVMRCLAAKRDCKSAQKLMELAAPEHSPEYAEPLNCLLRAYARADEVEDARTLFQELFNADLIAGDSFTAMASMYLRAGDSDSADMMLELRA